MVAARQIEPNPWNPNEMTEAMKAKERASISAFGFVDPLTVRYVGDGHYQIIDGEQRFMVGLGMGYAEFPAIVLDVDDDEARELTIILNDTRGTFREDKLAALVKDLAERRERARLASLLPYDAERIDRYIERREIDWEQLEQRREPISRKREEDQWVERVFRMPAAAAEVLDEAIEKIRADDEIDQDWRALEMMAADFLAR